MARIQVLVDDLMLQSKVVEMLRVSGHKPLLGGEPGAAGPGEIDPVALIVADIDAVNPAEVGGVSVPSLGFHRHTEPDKREAALAAGFDQVVPRSRMARELPELVAALLGAPADTAADG